MQTVADVTRTVQRWVDETSGQFSDFAGAFLFGGIVHLPGEDVFPTYRDVDLIVVLNRPGDVAETNLELLVEDVMVEVGFIGVDRFSSPEAILADPEMATNMKATTILADPMEILRPLQPKVQKAFHHRKWVQARCAGEMQYISGAIESMIAAETIFEKMNGLWGATGCLAGLVALADLQPPTHRRSLILSKKILDRYQRLDLHEQVLRLWGSAELTRPQVQSLLDRSIPIFDRAVAVHKTPVLADFKLKPHLRPYFLDASQEMIDEGYHREATFWITLPALVSPLAIMVDGTEQDKIAADALARDFFGCHGIRCAEDITARVPIARSLAKTLDEFTRGIVDGYPE